MQKWIGWPRRRKRQGKRSSERTLSLCWSFLGLWREFCRSGFVFLSVDTFSNPSALLGISWIAAYVGAENIGPRMACHGVPYISLNYLYILSAIYWEPQLSQWPTRNLEISQCPSHHLIFLSIANMTYSAYMSIRRPYNLICLGNSSQLV